MIVSDRLSAALADRYRIERELGQGGMATVYLAEDLKHKRKVALKVLKPELAAVLGAERFVQEITTTAALQHPHILPLFDSGTADGFLYYVMPFIQGETLRDKLNRETQLGVNEAVKIATDVADALHYAHTQGVIHRDIKPENILLANGRPMVADFGIALAVSAAAGGRMTETGLSLGTPHYMSPEQATAEKEITGRSDVYSLASVLYEMLAGQPPHLGGSAQQIIMKIIAEPVDAVTRYRKAVPPNVTAALAKALEKLPADRFDSAKAFAEALGNPAFLFKSPIAAASQPVTASWNRLTMGLAVACLAMAVALGAALLSRPSETTDTPVVRFAITDDDSLQVESGSTRPFAISPDGRMIVFRAGRDSTGPHLWLRTLDDPVARPIEGSLDGMNPAFSADGQWIAFITDNLSIKKVRSNGGSVTQVVRSTARLAALSWGDTDEIFFEQIGPPDGIRRVSANGGNHTLAVPMDTASGEISQRRPLFVRGAGVVVYGSTVGGGGEPTLVFYRLSDGRRMRSEIPGIGPLGMIDDRLVYSRADGTLMAVQVDAGAMKIVGPSITLEPRVAAAGTGTAVALSPQGTLVYRSADDVGGTTLALVDTGGQVRPLRGLYSVDTPLRFSPDGNRVAISARYDDTRPASSVGGASTRDVRVLDINTGVATRVRTSGPAHWVSWTSDGRLVGRVDENGPSELRSVPLDGSAESRLAAVDGRILEATSALPGGKAYVMEVMLGGQHGAALMRIWVDGSGRVDTLLTAGRSGVRPSMSRVSPDGRMVAFLDRNTGDVYVLSLAGGGALQVSEVPTGFQRPVVWGPDSRRVYYVGANGLNMIQVESSPALRLVGRSAKASFPAARNYDLHPDGKTFVMVNPLERGEGVHVAVNWAEEARRIWAPGRR
jgi:serine/threonine-protein kinase